jgi:hypothetical protein
MYQSYNSPSGKKDVGDEDKEEEFHEPRLNVARPRKRPRGQSLVSLSSATICSEEGGWNDSRLEVSCMVDADADPAAKCGPTGQTRTRVVKALYKLARPLGLYATNLHVRKKAKVPIISMVTCFGYHCDIAIGGHNGTDTSSYASAQVARFKR